MIALMCDQGFDPNSADYDCRTALMVAAMKGFTDTVELILEYNANPNLVDMHGTSALYEAVKNAHEDTMDVLMKHNAKLSMENTLAASTLCQTVYDNDLLTLRRLLRAGMPVNASDYDNRTAAHIAAAEGNLEALKALVEFGANLSLKDRWNTTLDDEAQRSNIKELLEYLDLLRMSPE
jgi:ankyrin repeat protein